MSDPVASFLARVEGSVLVGPDTVPGRYPRAAGSWRDLGELRVPAGSGATGLPRGVRAAEIGVHLRTGASAPSLVTRPTWPVLTRLRSRPRGEGWWVVLEFAGPVDVGDVLAELGRQAVWPGVRRVGGAGHGVRVVAAGDPVAEDVPPDVVVGGAAEAEPATSHVTGRPPLVVTALDGPLALGPLDERVLSPQGFLAAPDAVTEPVLDLHGLDLRDGATATLVARLRPVAGVRVGAWDDAAVRTVAGLALAGVPVLADELPAHVIAALGPDVAGAVTAPVDLADPLAREEHSVVLRRAAYDAFSSAAWHTALGARAGVPVAGQPAVSVVLATRRPEMLAFALAQVARQRGVASLELVLAPHGFEADPAQVRDAVGPGVEVQVVPQESTTLFGDVLDAAARAAAGDVVLKMDDDDWYGPDVVADLLRARATSGAELVGMPAEMHYLSSEDLTVRRGHPSELYARFVAGGTMLLDRSLLREVGGFRPVRKYVDAQLLDAVLAAGGAIYRTHGLGYVLRRNPTGHTWQVDLDYLLDPARVAAVRPGFAPSRLLEADPALAP